MPTLGGFHHAHTRLPGKGSYNVSIFDLVFKDLSLTSFQRSRSPESLAGRENLILLCRVCKPQHISRYVVTVPLCLPKPVPAVFSCLLSSVMWLQPSVIPTSPALPGPEDIFHAFFSNLFLVKALSGRRNKRRDRIAMEGPAVQEQH